MRYMSVGGWWRAMISLTSCSSSVCSCAAQCKSLKNLEGVVQRLYTLVSLRTGDGDGDGTLEIADIADTEGSLVPSRLLQIAQGLVDRIKQHSRASKDPVNLVSPFAIHQPGLHLHAHLHHLVTGSTRRKKSMLRKIYLLGIC